MSFSVIRNDLTRVCADAIVNPANPLPICEDRVIYIAAGEDVLLSARKRIGEMEAGTAAYTPAFALPAKYIIHTVGPEWEGGEYGEALILRNAYQNSLQLAKELGCQSIAFPLISTGALGFPKEESLRIAIEIFRQFLLENEMDIILVVFDKESFDLGGIFGGLAEYIHQHEAAETLRKDLRDIPVEAVEDCKPDCMRKRETNGAPKFAAYAPGASSAKIPTFDDAKIPDANNTWTDYALEVKADYDAKRGANHSGKRSLNDVMKQLTETWQESLFRIIDEKELSDVEVYKRANADRKLFSKIRGNSEYQPKKQTAIAFALALRLNLHETRDFLAKAGYALSTGNKFDLIILYFIENKVYDIYMINLALLEHGQALL